MAITSERTDGNVMTIGKIDISKLSLPELKSLRVDIDKAIKAAVKTRKKQALKAVEMVAQKHGYTLAELVGREARKSKHVSPPRYRHPNDPAVTWTGRGRRPAWIKEALAKGKKLESFAIK